MSFPAREQFDADERVTPRLLKLYRYCCATFDFWERRTRKGEVIAVSAKIDRSKVFSSLDSLVQFGYLIEHERDGSGARFFTLAWSVNPEPRVPSTRKGRFGQRRKHKKRASVAKVQPRKTTMADGSDDHAA